MGKHTPRHPPTAGQLLYLKVEGRLRGDRLKCYPTVGLIVMCDAPGCTDDALFTEPTSDHVDEKDTLKVCKRHVDPTKDGIERL